MNWNFNVYQADTAPTAPAPSSAVWLLLTRPHPCLNTDGGKELVTAAHRAWFLIKCSQSVCPRNMDSSWETIPSEVQSQEELDQTAGAYFEEQNSSEASCALLRPQGAFQVDLSCPAQSSGLSWAPLSSRLILRPLLSSDTPTPSFLSSHLPRS